MAEAKKKDYKKPMIIGLLIAVILLGYFFRDKWLPLFQKKEEQPNDSGGNSGNNTNPAPSGLNKAKVLKKGDRGAEVLELQKLMNEELRQRTPTLHGFIEEDGIFGDQTEGRLNLFTNKNQMSINEFLIEAPKTR